jgi:rare lipoprotein A
MKLPVKHVGARLGLALAVSGVALAAAMPLMAHSSLPPAPAMPDTQSRAISGPAADYPVVVGEAYRVGDAVFTPANTMNYDAVGFASVAADGVGVSAAHHTLPMPSYVEVTSLASGRTILVRVERRGPMDSSHAIELSPAAAAQLGVATDGRAPVRVRRVNPPEGERAMLRAGMIAPERMLTPKPLLAVLERRLANDPASGHAGAMLAQTALTSAPKDEEGDAPVQASTKATAMAKALRGAPPATGASFAQAFGAATAPTTAKPAPKPPAVAARSHVAADAPVSHGSLVIQIGAFAVKTHAEALAHRAGGQVTPKGNLWRVRIGPYSSQPDAAAALAKAKVAGYTDARIQRAE